MVYGSKHVTSPTRRVIFLMTSIGVVSDLLFWILRMGYRYRAFDLKLHSRRSSAKSGKHILSNFAFPSRRTISCLEVESFDFTIQWKMPSNPDRISSSSFENPVHKIDGAASSKVPRVDLHRHVIGSNNMQIHPNINSLKDLKELCHSHSYKSANSQMF